jgi:hypothetical protein
MRAALGISPYSYLYLKLAKMQCLSYYLLCFLFNKTGEQEIRISSAQQQGWGTLGGKGEERGGGPNNVYTCK